MTVNELTAADLAVYARFALGADEFESLPIPTQHEVELSLIHI